MSSQSMTIRVALDWTPNTIHSGLFVAQAQHLYADVGLNVELLPPDDSYDTTPARLLAAGKVDLAICPSESCIAYAESGKANVQAIYAILQKDASAIVSIQKPSARVRDLQSGRYGSYNARYEDRIVRAMVDADGGNGETVSIEGNTGKLSLFQELKNGSIDATWIFLPWEGVDARRDGVTLDVFRTEDYNIPYGYSPVIARDTHKTEISEQVLQKFVQATRRGYELAIHDPQLAVEALKDHCTPVRSADFLSESQNEINKYYHEDGSLGSMKDAKWLDWLSWLNERNLVTKRDLQVEDLFTNQFHT